MNPLGGFLRLCQASFMVGVFVGQAWGSKLHELTTVYLEEPALSGLDIYQKVYISSDGTWAFVREHVLVLSLGRWAELSVSVPFLNQVREVSTIPGRVGDVKFSMNVATSWFSKWLHLNYFIEFNAGTGPDYSNIETHPMESYGFQEWRSGLIGFKAFRYFAAHFNFFYVFRGEDELSLFDAFLNGTTLNVFDKNFEGFKRGLGFNPVCAKSFFYFQNFPNDNVEILLALNSAISYPLVPFVEFSYSLDFGGVRELPPLADGDPPRTTTFVRQVAGSGVNRSQLTFGTKFFLADEHFALKLAMIIPLSRMAKLYDWGLGLGVRVDF